VWVSGEYPADQTYPVRWEFQQCLNDLGGTPLDVLEIGCGTGELLALAAERGHRAVGIDFSRSAVATAQARGLTAFAASLDDLAGYIPAGTRFDAAVVFHVIEHLTEPDTFLDAITRWLRPGARLFVSCPGPRRYTRLIGEQQCGRSDFWDYPPHHVLRWSIPALQAVAKRGGWRVLTVMEEPLSWVGAASHIGVARAMYRGRLSHPVGRRLSIAGAWASLLSAPRDRRSGVSLYLCAQRDN
jgi:SAM-dependent methyltransferase